MKKILLFIILLTVPLFGQVKLKNYILMGYTKDIQTQKLYGLHSGLASYGVPGKRIDYGFWKNLDAEYLYANVKLYAESIDAYDGTKILNSDTEFKNRGFNSRNNVLGYAGLPGKMLWVVSAREIIADNITLNPGGIIRNFTSSGSSAWKWNVKDYEQYKSIDSLNTLKGNIPFGQVINNTIPHMTSNKRGGILWRGDDDGRESRPIILQKFLDAKYPALWAVNIDVGESVVTEDFLALLRAYQSFGIELGDHTPMHTCRFYHGAPALENGGEGVDSVVAINGVDYYFLENALDTAGYVQFTHSDVAGSIVAPNLFITTANGGLAAYNDADHWSDYFVITSTDSGNNGKHLMGGEGSWYQTAIQNDVAGDPDTIILRSWYGSRTYSANDLALTAEPNVEYYVADYYAERLTQNGLKRLLEASIYKFKAAGLAPPRIFIHPGAPTTQIVVDTAALVMPLYNYVSSSVYINAPSAVYFNDNTANEYGMKWNDFNIETSSWASQRAIIADGIAKHRLMTNRSHYTASAAYYARLDSMISWIQTNKIPIYDQETWSWMLFHSKTDEFTNIIPPFNVDYDGDSVPDGYDIDGSATYATSGGSPEWDSCQISNGAADTLFSITDLGGIEKGINRLIIATKGAAGDSVQVVFDPDVGTTQTIKYPATTTAYEYYTSDLIVDYDCVTVDIYVITSDYSSGTVAVSYLELRRK